MPLTLVAAVVVGTGPGAYADDPPPGNPFAKVQCGQGGHPGCQLTVGNTVSRGGQGGGAGSRSGSGTGGTGSGVLPNCFGGLRGGGGVCLTPTGNGAAAGGPAGGGGPALPPVAVAAMARNLLALPDPVIRSSPKPEDLQLVQLPTWLWVDRSVWRAQSATASVPGVSVTATATPTRVSWSTGDGTTVTCRGPGTPYVGGDPARPSPDCGHVYRYSSAGEPGAAFPVKATVTWTVTWAGAGQTGTLAPLTTTATTALRVAESQQLTTQ